MNHKSDAPASGDTGGIESTGFSRKIVPDLSRTFDPGALLINSRAACKMLTVGPRKLWELTNCNAIPHRRIGRAVRFSPVELRRWIDAGCPSEAGAGERIQREARHAD